MNELPRRKEAWLMYPSHRTSWYSLTLALVVLLGSSYPGASAGTPPILEFDVPFTISCRCLPLKDHGQEEPEKELIEVVIPISARLQTGSEKDLTQCVYKVVSHPET